MTEKIEQMTPGMPGFAKWRRTLYVYDCSFYFETGGTHEFYDGSERWRYDIKEALAHRSDDLEQASRYWYSVYSGYNSKGHGDFETNEDGSMDLRSEGGGPMVTAPLVDPWTCDLSTEQRWGVWVHEFFHEATIILLPHRGHLKIPRSPPREY